MQIGNRNTNLLLVTIDSPLRRSKQATQIDLDDRTVVGPTP